jgi:hypothetical protein
MTEYFKLLGELMIIEIIGAKSIIARVIIV